MMIKSFLLLVFFFSVSLGASCPISQETNIVYSLVEGVGDASRIWVQDFLWWWKSANPSLSYLGLDASQLQSCNLSSFPNLRVYMNPGGNAYSQLSSLGEKGTENIINFVTRNSTTTNPSSYIGFCAGAYIASHDYIWETIYEGEGYYNFQQNPPLSLFPFTVEGSIVDIGDDQYGDEDGVKYRLVNVSNGHRMLYYGGSTFGWNGAPAYADPGSFFFDPEVQPLIFFQDFYGFLSPNIPAAWRYRNLVLTSVHPEADNCTLYDCPVAGTIPTDNILQNRAWIAQYINEAAQTNYTIPNVPIQPIFDTEKPHKNYIELDCYNKGALFCDTFDWSEGGAPPAGLWQWQRNQSSYDRAVPWNVTYDFSRYGAPASGNGYALTPAELPAGLYSKMIQIPPSKKVQLSYQFKGKTLHSGHFDVGWATVLNPSSSLGPSDPSLKWNYVQYGPLDASSWTQAEFPIGLTSGSHFYILFACRAGSSDLDYCALDSVNVTAL